MDAKRLEELHAICAEVLAQDAPDIAGLIELRDFADLARCAAAWAKVERELRSQGGGSVSLVLGHSGVFYSTLRGVSVGGFSVNSVEAEEVKP